MGSKTLDASNQWHSYQKGWTIGAAGRAHDPAFQHHRDKAIVAAYTLGYNDACAARNVALTAAAERYGYDPSPFRSTKARAGEAG